MSADASFDDAVISDLVALTRETAVPITTEAVHCIVIPEGSNLVSLKDQQFPEGMPPSRRKARARFFDAVSFCRYVGLFADEQLQQDVPGRLAEIGAGAMGVAPAAEFVDPAGGDIEHDLFHECGLAHAWPAAYQRHASKRHAADGEDQIE